jgi:hypothetical protein
VAATATLAGVERDRLLVLEDVLEVRLGARDRLVADGGRDLDDVLEVHAEVVTARLGRC